jgi:Phytanoyl-CoA dioxygenase (PhyH)
MPMAFHKDNSDKINGDAPDWTKPSHLLGVGIYLQDHTHHSGGLTVFEGSHSQASIKNGRVITEWGKRVYLKTEPGDVVVWYLKTSHAGDWGIPKIGLLNALPLKVLRKLHRFEFLFKPLPRLLSLLRPLLHPLLPIRNRLNKPPIIKGHMLLFKSPLLKNRLHICQLLTLDLDDQPRRNIHQFQ